MHVVRHEMTFLDPTFLLQRQLTKHFPQDTVSAPHKTSFCGTWE